MKEKNKMQNQQNKQNKKFAKGFTLIELLVVVIIIGILAAIALPQYRMAVAKSKYATIKEMTENLAQAVERYYLSTNTAPENLSVLDIDIPGEYKNTSKFKKDLPNGAVCGFNNGKTSSYQELICFTKVFGKNIAFLSIVYYNKPRKRNLCYAFSLDPTDLVNKFCQKETGKSTGRQEENYYAYDY